MVTSVVNLPQNSCSSTCLATINNTNEYGDKWSILISEMTVKYTRVRFSPSPLKYKL